MAQHRLNYHHLISQSAVSAAGPPLANAARVRLFSILRYFLSKQGMRDLGLSAAVPVAVLPVLVANVVRYQVLSRGRVGRRYLEWWGAATMSLS